MELYRDAQIYLIVAKELITYMERVKETISVAVNLLHWEAIKKFKALYIEKLWLINGNIYYLN